MLNILISSIKTGIFLIDEKTHEIVEANNAALTLTGFSREEVIGNICHKFICPSEIGRCPVSDLGQTIDDSE
ncbi:MAG: PAS domain-containing protein, partial [Syntrophorhabdaceae bacterium]|nr:PAS domain-containing protein [Syntrophorhabdaceae bacterium]